MRLGDLDALYRKVKTECNPYGKPTIDFESGKKVLKIIENEPTVEISQEQAIDKLNEIGWLYNHDKAIAEFERPQGEITEEDIQNAIKAGYENGYSMAQAKYQRPQGEWQITKAGFAKCPNCKCEREYPENFCGYCGADMRGDKK